MGRDLLNGGEGGERETTGEEELKRGVFLLKGEEEKNMMDNNQKIGE